MGGVLTGLDQGGIFYLWYTYCIRLVQSITPTITTTITTFTTASTDSPLIYMTAIEEQDCLFFKKDKRRI